MSTDRDGSSIEVPSPAEVVPIETVPGEYMCVTLPRAKEENVPLVALVALKTRIKIPFALDVNVPDIEPVPDSLTVPLAVETNDARAEPVPGIGTVITPFAVAEKSYAARAVPGSSTSPLATEENEEETCPVPSA